MSSDQVSILVVLLAVAAVVLHSLVARGADVTWRFFLVSTVFWLLKGLIDVPRHVDEMPYVMHLEFLKYGRFNLGAFLVFVLGLRTVLCYAGFTLAERLLARSDTRRARFRSTVGLAIFLHGLMGIGVELVARNLGWWTWKVDTLAVGPVHYFAVWGLWAAFGYPCILTAFVPHGSPRRQLARGVAHAFAWTIGLILVSIVPVMRNFVVFPVALTLMLMGFSKGGPVLRPMRRAAPPPAPALTAVADAP